MAKKKTGNQSGRKATTGKKSTAARPKKVVRQGTPRPARSRTPVAVKRSAPAKVVEVVTPPVAVVASSRKKGVRKATLTTGIRNGKPSKSLGRSRIPVDAPLEVVFQNDMQAREAFAFLGVNTIRELEQFHPDDLVMRLTSPAKQTVGRIRKILAMNNSSLEGDESFALDYQEQPMNPALMPPQQQHSSRFQTH